MPASLDGKLVVAISSRAVFDFEEENRVFERDDDAAYMALQRERLEQPAPPGVAGALVKKLLAFDAPAVSEAQRRVEVVVVSRNDPVSGPAGVPLGPPCRTAPGARRVHPGAAPPGRT
jgi:5'-nucleotidase